MRRLEVRGPRAADRGQRDRRVLPGAAPTPRTMLEILGRQIAAPVQFVKGLHTLYEAGARVFVEVGPKKALHGFVEDVLGSQHDDVLALFTNHPKLGDIASFNQALCGLYAAGLGLAPVASPAAAPATAPTPASGSRRSRTGGRTGRPRGCPHHVRPDPEDPHVDRPLRGTGPAVRRRARAGAAGVRRRARRRRRAGVHRWADAGLDALRWRSPAPPWACPASTRSSTTRTSRASSTASSSST